MKMVCEDSLKVKNLPKQLSDAEKEDLLRHFGATNVKIITSQHRGKCVAFAKFESKDLAKSALQRLHQLNILNSRLSVEYAEHDIGHGKSIIRITETNESNEKQHFKTFINKITAWNSSVSFSQPPPGHLKYVYPKPNRATINNIAHALASVPKFYTQVLHLMNRMNLPPPFSNVPDPPQTSQLSSSTKINDSEESEIESDSDDKTKEIIPTKRKLSQAKPIKRPKFIKPNVVQHQGENKIEDIEKVFEKNTLQQKKIELKVTSESLQDLEQNFNEEVDTDNKEAEVKETNSIINEEELESNRIPLKDLSVLNVFKDYHPGIPSSKLYIKNIAKTVQKSDLEYIYKRYVNAEANDSSFDIKLMQEGRMKGQAFVTLDSTEAAQKAVKETNGFILKDKPLVVVYGKSTGKK